MKFKMILAVVFLPGLIQAQFFQHIEISPFAYFDGPHESKPNWQNLLTRKKIVTVYNLDNLHQNWISIASNFNNINGGAGATVRLQKNLSLKNTEWLTGIGFQQFNVGSDPYTNDNQNPLDTLLVYPYQFVQFGFTEKMLAIQNMINYKVSIFRKKTMHLFGGAGFQYLIAFYSKLHENYLSRETKWNTSLRRWETTTLQSHKEGFSLKNGNHLQLLLPTGVTINFSNFFQLKFEVLYFMHLKNKVWSNEKNTYGASFGSSFRFKL